MSWEMDIYGRSSGGALGQMDDLENYALENESCSICGDIIINRGVLDCCQHWFCYTCIDNWAAITNRCPVCKREFQHVSCTPLYDTAGTAAEDEYSLASGDDDWYGQGESSALSFPSYYIDADAVDCLDDSDCKIRSGHVAAQDDSTLDTSIACDSCDKWYHALCVGFNPEMATGDSWLCPRCMPTKVKQDADVIMKQNFSEEYEICSDRTSTDASFSGRVSVSVADEGETALVVSMVDVKHPEIKGGLLEVSPGLKMTHETVADASILRNTDVFTRSQNKSSESAERSLQFSPIRESATTLFSSDQGNLSNAPLEAPTLVSPCSFTDNIKEAENRGQENAVHNHSNERSIIKSPQLPSPASKMVRSPDMDMINADAVQLMKTPQNMKLPLRHDEHKNSDGREKQETGSGSEVSHPSKKAKLEVQEQDINLIGNSGVSSTHGHTSSVSAKATCGDMSEVSPQHNAIPDILSIVEGEDYRRDLGREQAKPVGRRAGDKPGLRVKKILPKEGNESSVLVQKLQQEIREVVRDTGTNILEKDGSFDEKLLTAFRAAIGKSVDGPGKNANLSLLRTKRALLQKGKKRENLTKKLYGTSTGRRRSAWHRDWEVEFWKYRCSPGVNPEKIETLQSVLQLLKKSSEMDKESAQGKKVENSNSIMSRLYLADASVVPRKDDIKPLSVLSGCAPLDKSSEIKGSNIKSPNKSAVGTEAIRINSPSSTAKVSTSSGLNKEITSRKENGNSQHSQNQKQTTGDIKHDKRKWALEILARKNASSVTSKDQTGDTDALKGNFPLLAQLPADMRPQLTGTAGRNNKVPLSVRQAQLQRIAEHYLQKANLDVIRKCAATELAIADAVNVEKDIYERSNSKLVYVNLCSQAARQPAKVKSNCEASALTQNAESGCDHMSQQVTSESTKVSGSDTEDALNRVVISNEKSELGDDIAPEQSVRKHTVSFSSAEEALKEAGLFDSPPNSPERETTEVKGGVLRCTDDLDSEPSKIFQSSSESRLKDVPSLEDDNSTVMACQKTKAKSEEHQKLTPSRNNATSESTAINLAEDDRCTVRCERTGGPGTGISVESNTPNEDIGNLKDSKDTKKAESRLLNQSPGANGSAREGEVISTPKNLKSSREGSSGDSSSLNIKHPKGDKPAHPAEDGSDSKKSTADKSKRNTSDSSSSIYKKVEMFVKEHIRPLCKSGVITVDQYRWSVTKTTDKVMNFHRHAKNANFLIKEGDKVKKLALQYAEAAQQKVN